MFSEVTLSLAALFSAAVLGYLLGRVRICGVGLGTAGIFLAGLLLGHLGLQSVPVLQTLGLVLFINSVGFNAGKGFFERLRKNGPAYAAMCLATTVTGCLVCVLMKRLAGLSTPLAVGVMTGAFTTSPAFAAARDCLEASPEAVRQLAVGYGLAYPVGTVCKVLFIQIIPRLLHADMAAERALIRLDGQSAPPPQDAPRWKIDPYGLCAFSAAAVLGLAAGTVRIPLPGSGVSLGAAGGVLLASLLFAQAGHAGRLDLTVDPRVPDALKEFGLILFFSQAGIDGGHGAAEVLRQYGLRPLLCAVVCVSIPYAVGCLLFLFVLKLPLLNGLGAMSASMTCTPSLAMLAQMAGTDDVAAAYATTYPIALILLVLSMQFLTRL